MPERTYRLKVSGTVTFNDKDKATEELLLGNCPEEGEDRRFEEALALLQLSAGDVVVEMVPVKES